MHARVVGVIAAFVVVACGGDSSSPVDAGGDAVAVGDVGADVFVTASHPSAPTVQTSNGPVLTAPTLVVITFGGDVLAPGVESFAQAIGASSYWSATTSEYGIGPAQYGGAVHVTAPPQTTISQPALETWLASQLDGTHSDWPAASPSTIYTVVYPLGAGIEVDGVAACDSSPAYHGEITVGSAQVPYAALNRCDGEFGLSGIDFVTAGLSHEWVEAATDPFYFTHPAYQSPAARYDDWMFATGGELADMCTTTNAVYFKPADLPFTVQRTWSNAAAVAGGDPCVPAPSDAYFAAAPLLSDTLEASVQGQSFSSEGVHVALGSSVTIPVALFSEAPTIAPWHVRAAATGAAHLTFAWDQTTGQNGDVLALTITRTADDPSYTGFDAFIITSELGARQSAWVGAVGN